MRHGFMRGTTAMPAVTWHWGLWHHGFTLHSSFFHTDLPSYLQYHCRTLLGEGVLHALLFTSACHCHLGCRYWATTRGGYIVLPYLLPGTGLQREACRYLHHHCLYRPLFLQWVGLHACHHSLPFTYLPLNADCTILSGRTGLLLSRLCLYFCYLLHLVLSVLSGDMGQDRPRLPLHSPLALCLFSPLSPPLYLICLKLLLCLSPQSLTGRRVAPAGRCRLPAGECCCLPGIPHRLYTAAPLPPGSSSCCAITTTCRSYLPPALPHAKMQVHLLLT